MPRPAPHAVTSVGLLVRLRHSRGANNCPVDPDIARARITTLIPADVANRNDWAIDMFAAFEALRIEPSDANVCAVIAVTAQESSFPRQSTSRRAAGNRTQADRLTRRSLRIPKLLVNAALALQSPTGVSYAERLSKVRTEKGLSDIFTDFIGMVPLGRQLFADLNPVHTGGPMQVSIAYAQAHAKEKTYPYPLPGSIRDEVFTRRGGIYFGTAHLLDYPVAYDEMLFRFADFNAGHYASRNAAFQSAVSTISGMQLALDGDLLRHGSAAGEPSNTELAVRKVAGQLDLSDAQIRSDLERGSTRCIRRDQALRTRIPARRETSRSCAAARDGAAHPPGEPQDHTTTDHRMVRASRE